MLKGDFATTGNAVIILEQQTHKASRVTCKTRSVAGHTTATARALSRDIINKQDGVSFTHNAALKR